MDSNPRSPSQGDPRSACGVLHARLTLASAALAALLATLLLPRPASAQGAFEVWRESHFTPTELANPTVSGVSADASGDGVPNLLKYALALDPRAANGGAALPSVSLSAGRLTLTYTRARAATDLAFFVEASNDLQSWLTGPGQVVPLGVASGGQNFDWVQVGDAQFTEAGTSQKRFLRLRVLTRGTLGSDGTADDWKLAAFGTLQADGRTLNAAGVPLSQAANPLDPHSPAMTVFIVSPANGSRVP